MRVPSDVPAASARRELSACIIAQDEEERLPGALRSLEFCDEVIVVDGGSRDHTVALAQAAGAKVIENSWPGFAAQRNVALDAARGQWVLEIDADERVSPQLRASIEEFLAAPGSIRIAICPLRNRFLGRWLGPSAKYPAYRTRLFRKDAYRHDESRVVHEGIEPRERPAVLAGDLEHELASTLKEALSDVWSYARLESRHLSQPRNPLAYLIGIVLRPSGKLLYRLIVDGGFRDGWRGALKIALDSASDALVWVLALIRSVLDPRRGSASASSGGTSRQSPRAHFGRRPAGDPKVVAIAAGESSAARAQGWLEGLAAHRIDVALICNVPVAGDAKPPTRVVRRLGPLGAMRALDLETQIRTVQTVVAFGWRARLTLMLLPRSLRPQIAGLRADEDPSRAASTLLDRRACGSGPHLL